MSVCVGNSIAVVKIVPWSDESERQTLRDLRVQSLRGWWVDSSFMACQPDPSSNGTPPSEIDRVWWFRPYFMETQWLVSPDHEAYFRGVPWGGRWTCHDSWVQPEFFWLSFEPNDCNEKCTRGWGQTFKPSDAKREVKILIYIIYPWVSLGNLRIGKLQIWRCTFKLIEKNLNSPILPAVLQPQKSRLFWRSGPVPTCC